MHIKRDLSRFFLFIIAFNSLGLLKNCVKHWYINIGYSLRSKKADRFFAVVALRLLKYVGLEISYSKSNVLSLL